MIDLVLLIIIIKVFVYPYIARLVYQIGTITGFWRGWTCITIGMIIPIVTVILQGINYFSPLYNLALFSSLCSLISMLCMGIGFHYIKKEAIKTIPVRKAKK